MGIKDAITIEDLKHARKIMEEASIPPGPVYMTERYLTDSCLRAGFDIKEIKEAIEELKATPDCYIKIVGEENGTD